ncbi:hypothetical protein HYPBUDRAFT_147914 [Hyphopichia burtonii NRRL Y-1933]|uniref:C2H2-type domain-containing protein n=1 Tax=Hyphopichia burtonii NRRL Y-1933 TaxID=984485 RepID=A0A1E4RJY1_9ASCO|nr:hypothetical protein HYPBUDRAFT_147914 [Hyphopichia burtonii NRRL Y-1933]ODV67592.1 hypothetical protein HYPBUDRAFT_147914 [Hyphopichia burtonii NRRL Y-1933]
MTSLAVIPPLKRTITDIMDEELYHLPSSPLNVQSTSNNAGAAGVNRSDSPKPASLFRNMSSSVNSSPALGQSSLYAQPVANNLPNLLNIPDSFLDQYNRLNGSNNNLASISPSSSTNNIMDDGYQANQPLDDLKISPFSDYGNPDSINTQPSFIHPNDVYQIPSHPRRRRITTLDDDDGSKSKQKRLKDENYYLFNTDIQPSSLVMNNHDLYSDSLFIPNDNEENNQGYIDPNGPIPGYENDYLMMDHFDEDVEEDLSDDDDDEDDFFNDDNEFDDFIMNSQYEYLPQDDQQYQTQQPPQQPPQQEPEIKPWDMYIKDNLMNGGFIDDFGVNKEEVVDGNPKEILSPPPLTNLNINDHKHEEEDDDDQMVVDDTPMKTAAEISANNPNHQCDKINPSTGKPCNKQFSRPYDLIRHQETIHALKKKIFRCVICEGRLNGGDGNGKQKTFSRGDALSRHIKVKHGLGGKDALDLINEAKKNVEYVSI